MVAAPAEISVFASRLHKRGDWSQRSRRAYQPGAPAAKTREQFEILACRSFFGIAPDLAYPLARTRSRPLVLWRGGGFSARF
jgi:hypothetical protein